MASSGYSIEVYQRADGWWSFRINSQESHYRSSNADGLQRTINQLLQGKKPGTVEVKAVKAGAAAMASVGAAVEGKHWADHAKTEDRVAAFLSRGKLGKSKE